MREIQQRIRQYELMAVFSPDVTEEDLPGAIEKVGGYIETAGGQIVSTNQESPWGRRRLAYSIRYQGRDVRDGYYVLYFFDIQSTQIAEIEHEIGLNDKLIRHILTIRGEIPVVPEVEEGAEGAPAATTEVVAPRAAVEHGGAPAAPAVEAEVAAPAVEAEAAAPESVEVEPVAVEAVPGAVDAVEGSPVEAEAEAETTEK